MQSSHSPLELSAERLQSIADAVTEVKGIWVRELADANPRLGRLIDRLIGRLEALDAVVRVVSEVEGTCRRELAGAAPRRSEGGASVAAQAHADDSSEEASSTHGAEREKHIPASKPESSSDAARIFSPGSSTARRASEGAASVAAASRTSASPSSVTATSTPDAVDVDPFLAALVRDVVRQSAGRGAVPVPTLLAAHTDSTRARALLDNDHHFFCFKSGGVEMVMCPPGRLHLEGDAAAVSFLVRAIFDLSPERPEFVFLSDLGTNPGWAAVRPPQRKMGGLLERAPEYFIFRPAQAATTQ